MDNQIIDNEIWKPLVKEGFNGLYEISNFGRVRNTKGEIKKAYRIKQGNLTVPLVNGEKQSSFVIKKLVAKHFIENPLNHSDVIIIDGDIYNIKADNLKWGYNDYEKESFERTGKICEMYFGMGYSIKFLSKYIGISEANISVHLNKYFKKPEKDTLLQSKV